MFNDVEIVMGKFFKPWRRKVGCVALMMALVFMAGWLRNHFYEDMVQVRFTDTTNVSAHSMYDSIQAVYPSHESPLGPRPDRILFSSTPVTPSYRGIWDPWKPDNTPSNEIHLNLTTPFFRFVSMTYGSRHPSSVHVMAITFSDLPNAFLLSLLSAYLLLWKPRTKPTPE